MIYIHIKFAYTTNVVILVKIIPTLFSYFSLFCLIRFMYSVPLDVICSKHSSFSLLIFILSLSLYQSYSLFFSFPWVHLFHYIKSAHDVSIYYLIHLFQKMFVEDSSSFRIFNMQLKYRNLSFTLQQIKHKQKMFYSPNCKWVFCE